MGAVRRLAYSQAAPDDQPQPGGGLVPRHPERHLIIAGTGRAGTSFLVRYLTELGLDTTLARQGTGRVGIRTPTQASKISSSAAPTFPMS